MYSYSLLWHRFLFSAKVTSCVVRSSVTVLMKIFCKGWTSSDFQKSNLNYYNPCVCLSLLSVECGGVYYLTYLSEVSFWQEHNFVAELAKSLQCELFMMQLRTTSTTVTGSYLVCSSSILLLHLHWLVSAPSLVPPCSFFQERIVTCAYFLLVLHA